MITDLQLLAQASTKKRAENLRLKEHLLPMPTRSVDALVVEISERVTSVIDCTQCGNCCSVLEPPVTTTEMNLLAGKMNMTGDQFSKCYVAQQPNSGIAYLKQQPCIFLTQKKCSIYADRPASCGDYPHLTQPNIKYRWRSILANYAICPIVYNVIEQLKDAVAFPRQA